MSTLVNILLAVVLQLLHAGEVPKKSMEISCGQTLICEEGLQQLNPHYLVTRDELLSHLKKKDV